MSQQQHISAPRDSDVACHKKCVTKQDNDFVVLAHQSDYYIMWIDYFVFYDYTTRPLPQYVRISISTEHILFHK